MKNTNSKYEKVILHLQSCSAKEDKTFHFFVTKTS